MPPLVPPPLPDMPLPSRQTLYRVNCRLFRIGYVRRCSGIIGSRSLDPSPVLLHRSRDCRRTHADSIRWCAHIGVLRPCVCACIGRRPIGCGVAASGVPRAGARARVVALFPPPPLPRISPRVLFRTASSFIRQRAAGVSSRGIEFLACFTPAPFIANSKYRPIPISRITRFLTTTIFRYDKAATKRRYIARGT